MWMKENAVYENSIALRIDSWGTLAVTNQKRGKDFTHTHTHAHMTSEYNSLSSSLLFLHFIFEWGTVLSSWFAALRQSVGTPRSQRSFQGAPWDPWESISLLLQGTWKRHARRVWVSPGDTAWTRRQLLVRFPHSKWKQKRRAAKLPFYLHQHWIKLRHN